MSEKQDWFGLSEDELVALLVALIVVVVMVFYFVRSNADRSGDGVIAAVATATAPAVELAPSDNAAALPPVAAASPTPIATAAPSGAPAPLLPDVEPATNPPTFELPGTRFLFGAVLLNGTGDPGTQVDVQVDGRTLGATRVGRDGQWSYTLGTGALAPGERTITAIGRAADGTLLPAPAQRIVMEAPEAPVFDGAYDGLTRVPGAYTIRGKASPNWRVLVQVNDWPPLYAATDAGGNWALELALDRPAEYTITAFAVDTNNQPIPTRSSAPARVTIAEGGVTPTPLVALPVDTTPAAPQATPVLTDTQTDAATVTPPVTDTLPVTVTPPISPTVVADATPAPTATPAGPLDALRANGEFSTLLAAIEAADLGATLSDPAQPVTLFAPDDAAFAALPDGAVDAYLGQPDELRQLLAQHLVAGDLGTAELAALHADGTTALATLSGDLLPLEVIDGQVRVGGAPLATDAVRTPGGALHPIDRVLLPASDIVAPQIDAEGVPTFEGRFLTVVGSGTPGSVVLLESNGALFGTTLVGADGRWLISNNIEAGEYTLVAYAYETGGLLRAASPPVQLVVR